MLLQQFQCHALLSGFCGLFGIDAAFVGISMALKNCLSLMANASVLPLEKNVSI